jgi:hypothetical protein
MSTSFASVPGSISFLQIVHFIVEKLMKLVALVLLSGISCGVHAQMQKQQQCDAVVKKDMELTRRDKPDVFATVKDYMFEFSKSRDTCVVIIQYRIPPKGSDPAKIQILAYNAVTMQLMEGYDHVYLIPANETKEIMNATTELFEYYSK